MGIHRTAATSGWQSCDVTTVFWSPLTLLHELRRRGGGTGAAGLCGGGGQGDAIVVRTV